MDSVQGKFKEFLHTFGRLLDLACYGIERSRGVLIDPLNATAKACKTFLWSLLIPKLKQERVNAQLMKEEIHSYCLNSPQISFFDTFLCINGIPAYPMCQPVATDSCEDTTPPTKGGTNIDKPETSRQTKPLAEGDSAFKPTVSDKISMCSFSFDGSKLAVCCVSGEVTIWDTNHGTQLGQRFIGAGSISNASFLGEESSVLVIYTKNYTCWRWDIDNKNSKPLKICDRVVLSGINGEVVSQKSSFYENGTKLVLATIINAQLGPVLEVASMNSELYLSDNHPRLSNSVLIQDNFVVSNTTVALDGKGVLVGLMDKELEESYCMLWPNFAEDRASCNKLDKGTIGTWSNDSKHVVTWIMTNKPNLDIEDENSAFIWNVKELRENLSNPEYSFKPKKITNPFGEKVFWCHVIRNIDHTDRLIMGVNGEFTRFLFWDVETSAHTHTIATGISAKDMMLCSKEKWIGRYVKQESVKGLSPMSVSKDGSMFGAILGWPSKIIIWDAHHGIEVLKVSPMAMQANRFKGGIDLVASSSCAKFAIVGNNEVMVFCPSAPCNNKKRAKNCLESQMVQLDNPHVGEDSLSSFKMSFSGDGGSLGVLCIGSSKMQVWSLAQGNSCTIESACKTEGGNIQDFCLSHNGKYLVIYIGMYVQIVDCEAKGEEQMIGTIKIDSKVVCMGIKHDCSELVLCMEDGSICWYELLHEDVQNTDENAPSTRNIHGVVRHRLASMERFKSWFKRSNVDVEKPLLSGHRRDDQSTGELIYIHIPPSTSSFKYVRHVLEEKIGNATFQISPTFEEVIRISTSEGVEAWNLDKKAKREDRVYDIASVIRSSYMYSHNSSLTKPVLEELVENKVELLEDTSIDLTNRTTLIQSSKQHVIVAGNCSSRNLSLWRNQTSLDVEHEKEKHEQSHSIYVINLNNVEYRRRLSGKDLKPEKGLAISHDGRHVACLAGDNASKVVVWNVYASERLLPDYNFLSLTLGRDMYRKEGIKQEVQPLIDELGVNFFNVRHSSGMSIFEEAICYFNSDLLRAILQYVLRKKIKVSFLMQKTLEGSTPASESHNVIEVSIARRSPKTLGIVLKYLIRRVTHEVELTAILTRSLVLILPYYPSIFVHTIRDCKVLGPPHQIEVPESSLEEHKFIPCTSDSLNTLEEKTIRVLNEESENDARDKRVPLIESIARIFPYENACNIGVPGLLRDLVIGGAHHDVYSSFVVSSIVEYKWSEYAKRLFVHELCHHCLVALSFSVYCFLLCTDKTYKLNHSIRADEEDEEGSSPTLIALLVCWIFAVPCLFRELRQCVVYTTEHKLRGFVFWLKSGWNWIEVISYLNLIFTVPLGQHYWLHNGKDTTTLSALVAVESLLLWSRMLFYARPFSSTGPLVATMTCIVCEIFPFVFLTACVMFGFALAFRVLYRHVDCTEEDDATDYFKNQTSDDSETELLKHMEKAFGSFTRSFFTVFSYTFGEFDLENQYGAPESYTALILFVLYVVIIAIILLNMLIALMSEKFARIHKNRKTRLIEARARAIDDIDSMLSYKERKKLGGKIKRYLQVVIPSHQHATMTKGHSLRKSASKVNEDMIKTVRTQIHYSLLREQKMRDRPALPSPDRPLTTQKTRFFQDPLHTIPESSYSATSRIRIEEPSIEIPETEVYSSDDDSSDSMSFDRFGNTDSD